MLKLEGNLEGILSQTFFQCRESYPLIVKASDLVSSLDVQEFGVGKYVVKWAREGESRATTTTFELSPLKVMPKYPPRLTWLVE